MKAKKPGYVEAEQFDLFKLPVLPDPDEFRCAVCKAPFSRLKELREHFYEEHPQPELT
jgi:hypothetical protein